jgi:ubiquinone/menaquinone biosynthesis C-methylase UbiE
LSYSNREIQEKYQKAARWYDRIEGIVEFLGLRRLRRRLLSSATGRVLDLAAGTGRNLPHYPRQANVVAADLSPDMLRVARGHSPQARLSVMDAAQLAFPNSVFDTVVSSMAMCTYPDPVGALREMARVCRPGGRMLLLEHGRSDHGRIARWQDGHAGGHARMLGCWWNRDPLALVTEAGLRVVHARRAFLGIVYIIEVSPSQGSSNRLTVIWNQPNS